MITRVDIENLVIVERASFEPGRGLTAITGETGAGKTLFATAIGLLFGADADASQVGPAGGQAWVEGEFDPATEFWQHPEVAALAELRPEVDAPLVLARRVDSSGRSRALAWGRTVTKGDLAAAGRLLVATAGQHVQVRLRSSEYQRMVLDSRGDGVHSQLRAQMQQLHGAWCAAKVRLEQVEAIVAAGAEHAEQLRYDVERIDAVAPSVAEETELVEARDRARHHEAIVRSLALAGSILEGDDAADGGAIDLAGRAYAALEAVTEHDPGVGELAGALLAAQEQLSEVASAVSSRLQDLADGPGSLADLEDRLAAFDELKRQYGGTIDAVLARRDAAREQLNALEDSSGSLAAARAACDAAYADAVGCSERLTASRCALADTLAADVRSSLDELGMSGSIMRVAVEEAPLSAHGADRVELLLAPSAGIEPRPVAQVASGGELSRIALSLLIATAGDDGVGTILFDEIDAGIGGHTAHAVASLLRRLADRRQVLCITHVAQVAARADSHVVIEKHEAGGVVRTDLRSLSGEEQVLDELVRMLGGASGDQPAREHARQLRGPRFDIAAGEPHRGVTASR